MTEIKLKGNAVHTAGALPAVGTTAPDAKLVKQDLAEVSIASLPGKKVLNIFPSLDTAVCATSVRRFNKEATAHPDVTVLNISMDLPFAHRRFCASEGIDKAVGLSGFRSDFGAKYGVTLKDSGMVGLFSRAVVVVDAQMRVLHAEQVPEITQEPDYEAALRVL
jgi:thioredoxin-dependent peroxiredoxin